MATALVAEFALSVNALIATAKYVGATWSRCDFIVNSGSMFACDVACKKPNFVSLFKHC